jgi:NDP-sugar pyrophosphorylase family protein
LIIPAAGLGSRLQASTPKALVPVLGKPMIDRLLDLYRTFVDRIVVIAHSSFAEKLRAHTRDAALPVDVLVQETPTGMLDAILIAHDRVAASDARRVWVTWCDQVAVDPATVERLAALGDEHPSADLILPTAARHAPYVHLERDPTGRIVRILHRREGDTMPADGESDMGLFSLARDAYLGRLPQFAAAPETGTGTGERNFLPFIPWIAARGEVVTFPCVDEMEAVGVNTPEELRAVEAYLSARERTVLSIVIPAYNEERFIGTLLKQIKAVDLSALHVDKEIIVVDDCSRDRTAAIVSAEPGVRLHRMERNGGKGRAVRTGIGLATGEYLIIQDADLEYDPNDYVPMLQALLAGRADVIYGSRYLSLGKHAAQSWTAYLGGRSLSVIALAFTGRYLTDTVTALKLFRRSAIASLPLETSGFELDHEITSRMLARGATIAEVPIRYSPRSRAEGKKIGLRDWFIGARTFWRYRRG